MAFLDDVILGLLHLDDGRKNELLDASECKFRLRAGEEDLCESVLKTIRDEHRIFVDAASFEGDFEGLSDFAKKLEDRFEKANDCVTAAGLSLYLGVGALKWRISIDDSLEIIKSPILIFPVREARRDGEKFEIIFAPARFNPVLISKLRRVYPDAVSNDFPHPNGEGADFDEVILLEKLGDGRAYFNRVEEHARRYRGEDVVFELERDSVVLSPFDVDDISIYYDLKARSESLRQNPLVLKVFGREAEENENKSVFDVKFVLPKDSVQQDVTARATCGESIIVTGARGTGKTTTAANIIAALIANGKKVLFSSNPTAISEVNSKLPNRLRKFVLPVSNARRDLDAKNILAEMRAAIRDKKNYLPTPSSEYEAQLTERNRALSEIVKYFSRMYVDLYGGRTYYEALDAYLKEELCEVAFAPCESVANLSDEQYRALKDAVSSASKYLEVMLAGGVDVTKCVWHNVGLLEDVAGASALAKSIKRSIDRALELVGESYASDLFGEMKVKELMGVSSLLPLSADEIKKLVAFEDESRSARELSNLLVAYKSADREAEAEFNFVVSPFDERFVCLDLMDIDKALKVSELKFLHSHASLVYKNGSKLSEEDIDKATGEAIRIKELAEISARAQKNFTQVFKNGVNDKQKEILLDAYEDVEKYIGMDEPSPALFDFASKKLYGKVLEMTDEELSFKEVVGAVGEFYEFVKAERETDDAKRTMDAILGCRAEEEDLEFLRLLSRLANGNVNDYIKSVEDNYAKLTTALAGAEQIDENCTIGRFIDAYTAYKRRILLKNAISQTLAEAGVEQRDGDVLQVAKSVIAAKQLRRASVFEGASDVARDNIIDSVKALDPALSGLLTDVVAGLISFKNRYFSNFYSSSPYELTLDDLKFYSNQATNVEILSASLNFYRTLDSASHTLALEPFFKHFESRCEEPQKLADVFEHSFFKLAIEFANAKLAGEDMGKGAALNFERFDRAERSILTLNAARVEGACLKRIDENDEALHNLDENLDVCDLFSTGAETLFKMKDCFMLSPATVSELLENDAFSFDVAVIDDGDSLSPVQLLPALARAKQCVILGNPYRDEGESALKLCLSSRAFFTEDLPACYLKCDCEGAITFPSTEFCESEEGAYPNFVNNVAKFVVSCGFDAARVRVGYGKSGQLKVPVAILSEDLTAAVFGIWCEVPMNGKYNYLDYNTVYFNCLVKNGWKMARLSIYDWMSDPDGEKQRLKDLILEKL